MRKLINNFFLFCGLSLTLATFPVFAQNALTEQGKHNTSSLRNLGETVLKLIEEKKIDLTKSFSIEMETSITQNGNLDEEKIKYIKTEGDEKLINVAKKAVSAVSGTEVLVYLKQLGVNDVRIVVQQDEKQLFVLIKSPQATEAKSKTIAAALNTLVSLLRKQSDDADDLNLINGLKTFTDSKHFSLSLTLDIYIFREIIEKNLRAISDKQHRSINL